MSWISRTSWYWQNKHQFSQKNWHLASSLKIIKVNFQWHWTYTQTHIEIQIKKKLIVKTCYELKPGITIISLNERQQRFWKASWPSIVQIELEPTDLTCNHKVCAWNKNPVCQIQNKNLERLIHLIFILCILEVHFEETSNAYPGRWMYTCKIEDMANRMNPPNMSNSGSLEEERERR